MTYNGAFVTVVPVRALKLHMMEDELNRGLSEIRNYHDWGYRITQAERFFEVMWRVSDASFHFNCNTEVESSLDGPFVNAWKHLLTLLRSMLPKVSFKYVYICRMFPQEYAWLEFIMTLVPLERRIEIMTRSDQLFKNGKVLSQVVRRMRLPLSLYDHDDNRAMIRRLIDAYPNLLYVGSVNHLQTNDAFQKALAFQDPATFPDHLPQADTWYVTRNEFKSRRNDRDTDPETDEVWLILSERRQRSMLLERFALYFTPDTDNRVRASLVAGKRIPKDVASLIATQIRRLPLDCFKLPPVDNIESRYAAYGTLIKDQRKLNRIRNKYTQINCLQQEIEKIKREVTSMETIENAARVVYGTCPESLRKRRKQVLGE